MLQETRKRLLAKAKALAHGMSEETRMAHLARAKKKLKEYKKKKSLGVPAGVKNQSHIKNGSDLETANSEGCHSPEESDLTEMQKCNKHLKESLQKLEHRVTRLEKDRDTTGENYVTKWHQEKEESISRLAQDLEEMKVNLQKLQELLLPLLREQHPTHEPSTVPSAPQEIGTADCQDDLCDVSLMDSAGSIQGEALSGLATPDSAQLQDDIKDTQECPGLGDIKNAQECPGLGDPPCFPFFYRANDHVNILEI